MHNEGHEESGVSTVLPYRVESDANQGSTWGPYFIAGAAVLVVTLIIATLLFIKIKQKRNKSTSSTNGLAAPQLAPVTQSIELLATLAPAPAPAKKGSIWQRFSGLSKSRQRLVSVAGIVMIALAGQVVYSSFAGTIEYSPIPAVANMQKLTEEVIELTNDYADMPDTAATKKGSNQTNQLKVIRELELIEKVKERKEAYKEAMQYDPQTTANFYLPEATRGKLPEESKQYLEQLSAKRGFWIQIISTPTQEAIESNSYSHSSLVFLTDESNTDTYLWGADMPDIAPGSEVVVVGVVVDEDFAVALPRGSSHHYSIVKSMLLSNVHAQDSSQEAILGLVCDQLPYCDDWRSLVDSDILEGKIFCVDVDECSSSRKSVIDLSSTTRKTLIVPLLFSDTPEAELGERYRSIESTAQAGRLAEEFFATSSYGQFTPEYEVYNDYLTLNLSSRFEIDTGNNESSECYTHLAKQRMNSQTRLLINTRPEIMEYFHANNFTDLAYSLPRSQCSVSFAGFASLGISKGGDSISELFVTLGSSDSEEVYASILAHEAGHTYGLHHANASAMSWSDNNKNHTLTSDSHRLSFNTEEHEYGDPYNIMGVGGDIGADAHDFNIINKRALNWVNQDSIAVYNNVDGLMDVDYTINALYKDSGLRAVAFDEGEMNHDGENVEPRLFIEYRPATSSDEALDKFHIGDVQPGILAYYRHDSNTTVLLSRGNDYSHAAISDAEPLDFVIGGEPRCITISDTTEESVTINIKRRSCSGGASIMMPPIENYIPFGSVIGHSPHTPWYELDKNSEVAVDSAGNMYALAASTDQIFKFDPDGNSIYDFGSRGRGDYQFMGGYKAIAVDLDDNLYVADRINHRILKYTPDGGYITQWGQTVTGLGTYTPGVLSDPWDISIDDQGNVYVVDRGYDLGSGRNPRYIDYGIKKFSSDGEYMGNIIPIRTTSVAVDGSNIYVASGTQINKYDSNGDLALSLGSYGIDWGFTGGFSIAAVNGSVYASDQRGMYQYDTEGTVVSRDWRPMTEGNIGFQGSIFTSPYTADLYIFHNSRIHRFMPDS